MKMIEWIFYTANIKQKMFAVTVCDRKTRKEIYDRRKERRNGSN